MASIILSNILWGLFLLFFLFLRKRKAFFEPIFYVGISHFLYFSTGYPGISEFVGLYNVIVFFGVLFGYLYTTKGRNINPKKNIGIKGTKFPRNFLVLCLIIELIWPVASFFYGFNLFEYLTRFYGNKIILSKSSLIVKWVNNFLGPLPLIGVIFGGLWGNLENDKVVKRLWWILCSFHFINCFSSGIRSSILFFGVGLYLAMEYFRVVFNFQNKNKKERPLLWSGILVLVVFSILFLSRYRSKKFNGLKEFGDKAFITLRKGSGYQEIKNEFKKGINPWIEYCVKNIHPGRDIPYLYSLYSILFNPIPRYFWKAKPVGFGKYLAMKWGNVPSDKGLSIAAGISGEGFCNLGYLGPLVFSIFFGFFLGWLKIKIFTTKDVVHLSIYLFVLSWVTGLFRGDWLAFDTVFYPSVSALIFYKINFKYFNRKYNFYYLLNSRVKGSQPNPRAINPHLR